MGKIFNILEDCVIEMQVSELTGLTHHVFLGLEPFCVIEVEHFLGPFEVLHIHQQTHRCCARSAFAVIAMKGHDVVLMRCVKAVLPLRCL